MPPFTRSASKRHSQLSQQFTSRESPQSQLSQDGLAVAATPFPCHTSHVFSTPAVAADRAEREVFRFMDLPSELRLHIYRMGLQRAKPLLLHLPRSNDPDDPNSISIESSDIDSRTPQQTRRTDTQNPGQITVLVRGPPDNLPARFHPTWTHSGRGGASRRIATVFTYMTAVKGVNTEPLVTEILRINKQIYREARPVLYAENEFALVLGSATHTLSSLHQRSRSLIKLVHLTIPSHHDVLEGFADVVRLGLRYCWGLKRLILTLPDSFPDDPNARFSPTTSVYANAFHILRWLPKTCEVELIGDKIPAEIKKIIDENAKLAETLDDNAYARRQHQIPEGRFQEAIKWTGQSGTV